MQCFNATNEGWVDTSGSVLCSHGLHYSCNSFRMLCCVLCARWYFWCKADQMNQGEWVDMSDSLKLALGQNCIVNTLTVKHVMGWCWCSVALWKAFRCVSWASQAARSCYETLYTYWCLKMCNACHDVLQCTRMWIATHHFHVAMDFDALCYTSRCILIIH